MHDELIDTQLVSFTKSLQVGFCNLIKKPKDQMNHLWIAEATENSTYYLDFKPSISHLKSAGASVQAWAKASSSVRTVKHRSDTTEFIP